MELYKLECGKVFIRTQSIDALTNSLASATIIMFLASEKHHVGNGLRIKPETSSINNLYLETVRHIVHMNKHNTIPLKSLKEDIDQEMDVAKGFAIYLKTQQTELCNTQNLVRVFFSKR